MFGVTVSDMRDYSALNKAIVTWFTVSNVIYNPTLSYCHFAKALGKLSDTTMNDEMLL